MYICSCPGIKYIQGMNELIAPIYYAFCSELGLTRVLAAGAAAAAEAEEWPGTD